MKGGLEVKSSASFYHLHVKNRSSYIECLVHGLHSTS